MSPELSHLSPEQAPELSPMTSHESISAESSAFPNGEDLLARIASDLYRIGSMLVGEGEDSIGVIENVLTNGDLPAVTGSDEQDGVMHGYRVILGREAITLLGRRDPVSLVAPNSEDAGPIGCIDNDDLDAAGVTRAELESMLGSSDNRHLRSWLEGLDQPQRVVFVLHAVSGLSFAEVAELLATHGGALAAGWTLDSVRGAFRLALCSLASQLLHATVAK